MKKLSVLYFIEPMMGLGSHYWAQTLAKAIAETHANIELTILVDDLVPFEINHERVHWIKLPVCRNQITEDGSLNFQLIDGTGKVVDENWKKERVHTVFSSFLKVKPDVVLLHNHLSGLEWDNLIDFEYQALVKLARKTSWNPPIVATAMDFIDGFEDRCEAREQEYLKKVQKEVDYMLVCGDSLESFIHSCPPAQQFRDKLVLTGYPVNRRSIQPLTNPPQSPEVLVAAGGSELGYHLFHRAIEVFKLVHEQNNSDLVNYPWRLLVGPNLKEQLPALQQMAIDTAASVNAQGKLIVQSTVSSSEYLSRLTHHSVLSVSQCGQGTFVDLEQAGVPAVVVPYEANGMVQEQLYRAEFLHNSGRGILLREQALTTESLFASMEAALSIGPKRIGLNLNGANFIANFVHDLAIRNRASQASALGLALSATQKS